MSNIFESLKQPYIAGPCAMDSPDVMRRTVEEALKRDIGAVRLPYEKPRTRGGTWRGLGLEEGLPLLVEVAQSGIIPATEVMYPQDAEKVINEIIRRTNMDVVLWLGRRNYCDKTQIGIGKVLAGEPRAMVIIKNPMWEDKESWLGAIEHVQSGGASLDQIALCHAGFPPRVNGFRNKPNFEMAMQIKQETGLQMLIDPSHIGGSVESVFKVAEAAASYRYKDLGFDGCLIEVHPDPVNAETDKEQQLKWEQFDSLREKVVFDNKLIKQRR